MNIITKLNIRQKVMLGLTLLAALFLGWQVFNFLHNQTPAVSHPAANNPGAPSAPALIPASAVLAPPRAVPQLPRIEEVNPYAQAEQREYLNLVHQYQVTKMKRQILEEEAGAANAQKNISDAGKGQAPTTPLSFSGFQSSVTTDKYQLSYLDRQAGQWVATISQNDQYQEVRVGMTLAHGWRVTSINRSGVVLRRNEKKQVLGFQGTENVDSQQSYSVGNYNLPPKNAPARVPVNKIEAALGMTSNVPINAVKSNPGVPSAKGAMLPNLAIIQPQSAKTAAQVVKDVPAGPMVTPSKLNNVTPAAPVTTSIVPKISQRPSTPSVSTMPALPVSSNLNVAATPTADPIIPAPAASTNMTVPSGMSIPAPEVSAANEVNSQPVTLNARAVSVKDLRQQSAN